MNNYDLTVVFDGKHTPAKKKSAVEKLQKLVTTFDGKSGKIVDHGEKKLAYPIKKIETGVFITVPVEILALNAKRLQDKLRLEEGILRYLFVKKDV